MTWLDAFGLAALSVLLGVVVSAALFLWVWLCAWLADGKLWGFALAMSPFAAAGFVVLAAAFKFGGVS